MPSRPHPQDDHLEKIAQVTGGSFRWFEFERDASRAERGGPNSGRAPAAAATYDRGILADPAAARTAMPTTARLRSSCVALLALLTALATVPAQSAPASSRPSTRSTADTVADRVGDAFERQRLVGMSIAWIEGGKVAASRSFGFADRERSILASDATLYRWASISKPVTAVTAMQLWERKRLDLDADVTRLVPEFPAHDATITARLLLSHQAGVVHYTNGKVVPRGREYASEHPFEQIVNSLDKFADSPLVCEPGSKHSYSTYGYILLGAVVERAGKEAFWQQVKARVALPAAMTTFQPDYQWVAIENRAAGYKHDAAGQAVRSSDTDVSWKLPGGG